MYLASFLELSLSKHLNHPVAITLDSKFDFQSIAMNHFLLLFFGWFGVFYYGGNGSRQEGDMEKGIIQQQQQQTQQKIIGQRSQ